MTRWTDLPRQQRLRIMRVITSKAKAVRKRKREAVLAQQVLSPFLNEINIMLLTQSLPLTLQKGYHT